MKKVHIPFKRPGKNGWWICWYENGVKKHKSFVTKSEADHYYHLQYMRLNSDVYTQIKLPFFDAKKEYMQKYILHDGAPKHVKFVDKVLSAFHELCHPVKTSDINQKMSDSFIASLKTQKLSNTYINNHSRALMSFFNWLNASNHLQSKITAPKLRQSPPRIRALNDEQIMAILKAAPTQEWKLRIILALCTGLRRGDLFRLPRMAIDLSTAYLQTQERKTGKMYTSPLPDDLVEPLKEFNKALPADRPYFFRVFNVHWLDKQFRTFRPDPAITLQSMRKTHSTRIESTGIGTAMLNHSNSGVTRKFYNDMDYIKHIRVNQLPIKQWLSAAKNTGQTD